MASQANARAELYTALAEALSEPLDWLAGAGRDWPLFAAAVAAAGAGSVSARRAVAALADVPSEPLETRRRRYRALFDGPGLQLYESLHVEGRLLGRATWAVSQVYRAAGLAAQGAELPDHASVELAFLGWLAEQEADHPDQAAEWRGLARRFIERHAGRWLPGLGFALAASGDPVYAPVGELLAGWLLEAQTTRPLRRQTRLPAIARPEACTLCGFCVQVCPTRALDVRETDAETRLVLTPTACVGCGKCERVCDFSALHLKAGPSNGRGACVLRAAPRAVCPGCGRPTVSRAELAAVAERIGEWPHWLDYCLECRAVLKYVTLGKLKCRHPHHQTQAVQT